MYYECIKYYVLNKVSIMIRLFFFVPLKPKKIVVFIFHFERVEF